MTAHVVVDNDVPSTQLGMKCLHCDGKLALALPVSVDEMVSATGAFDAKHRRCPPRLHAAPAAGGAK